MKTVSQAKADFNNLSSSGKTTLISKNGKIVSVLLPYEQFCEMYATHQRFLDEQVIQEAKHFLAGEKAGMDEDEMSQALEAAYAKKTKSHFNVKASPFSQSRRKNVYLYLIKTSSIRLFRTFLG